MNGLITRKQAIAYAIIAFNNFFNSANIDNFDISIMETFMLGAMKTHNRNQVVEYSEKIKEKSPLMKINKIENIVRNDV